MSSFKEQSYSKANQTAKVREKNKKKRQGLLFWSIGLTGVSILSATGGVLLARSLSTTPLKQAGLSSQSSIFSKVSDISYNNFQFPEFNRPVNILVLGAKVLASEANKTELIKNGYEPTVNSLSGLTDTILLLRFNPQTHKMTILSIPRDTRVTFPGHKTGKINAANKDGGAPLAAQTVSDLLNGVKIDRYVTINTLGLIKLIDIVGGVTVDIPKDIKYRDNTQHLYIDFKAGPRHLDGNESEQFLRFRHDELGDIGRIQRQQMFMRALAEQVLNAKIVLKVPEILSLVQSHVDTNLTIEEMIALSGFASGTKRSDMEMLMIPGDFGGNNPRNVSYWVPNKEAIQKMTALHFAEGKTTENIIDPTKLRIAIQNSTDNFQAAESMEKILRQAGYSQVYIYKRKIPPLENTKIVAQKGDQNGTHLVRNSLGLGEVLTESTGSLGSDITIQIGKDWITKQPKT